MNAYKLEVYEKVVRIAANVLVLAAVAVGMYQASDFPETFLAVFSQWFFALLTAVLALAWAGTRFLRKRYPVQEENDLRNLSVVYLPRRGPQLVRWRVLYAPSQRRREALEATRS